jgi:hypothetical protein
MEMGGQRHALAALPPPPERLDTHCTGGWVGPRGGLDRCRKSLPPPRFDPRTAQPVASRYTDCAIPGHGILVTMFFFLNGVKRNQGNDSFIYIFLLFCYQHIASLSGFECNSVFWVYTILVL